MTGDPRGAREGRVPGAGVLGMWLLLATLGVLFGAAIAGYLIVRLRYPDWPPAGMPRLPSGLWLATVLAVLASGAVQAALAGVRAGNEASCARRLRGGAAAAVAFLVVQGWNWSGLLSLAVTAETNLYAFTGWILSGLHAAHVVGGIVLLEVVARRAAAGRYRADAHDGVRYAAMYWHFLTVVWLVLFLVMRTFA